MNAALKTYLILIKHSKSLQEKIHPFLRKTFYGMIVSVYYDIVLICISDGAGFGCKRDQKVKYWGEQQLIPNNRTTNYTNTINASQVIFIFTIN